MRTVSEKKNLRGNLNTHFIYNNIFFENISVYEIMWKYIVERGRPHDNMMHAHCILAALGYK